MTDPREDVLAKALKRARDAIGDMYNWPGYVDQKTIMARAFADIDAALTSSPTPYVRPAAEIREDALAKLAAERAAPAVARLRAQLERPWPDMAAAVNPDDLRIVLAALAPPQSERDGWQTVETAPDAQLIIMFGVTDLSPEGKVRNWKMATGYKMAEQGRTEWDGRTLKSYDTQPTHWRPVPDPPTEHDIERPKPSPTPYVRPAAEALEPRCYQCGGPVSGMECESCEANQPPPEEHEIIKAIVDELFELNPDCSKSTIAEVALSVVRKFLLRHPGALT